MSNGSGRAEPLATRDQRLAWLRERPHLWEDWANGPWKQRQKRIVKLMQADGVVSIKTYWPDVHVNGLVAELQRE